MSWDEKAYKDIARRSGSKQAVKDVAAFRIYKFKMDTKCMKIGDKAMIMCSFGQTGTRIIGVAVAEEHKGGGALEECLLGKPNTGPGSGGTA